MIKAILFDFFDVFYTDVYKAWLSRNNILHEGEYAKAAYDQNVGHITNEQFYQRLSNLQGRQVTREELYKDAGVDQAMVELAMHLRKHYKTALISNAPSQRIRGIMQQHDLERLFDAIIVSSEVNLVKPSAEIFHLALERLGIKADEAIFIDDDQKHTNAATTLGITSIQFTAIAQLRTELSKQGIILNK